MMKPAPFVVNRSVIRSGEWALYRRENKRLLWIDYFPTQSAAIDHAYRNWPWWP